MISQSLPWHQPHWQKMTKLFEQGRMPHALLFWGQSGLGKQHFATLLAKRLLCLSENQACGQCQSCRWLLQGTHPDFIEIELEKDKKVITVEQVRQLQAELSLSSTNQNCRVVLISHAEKMNAAAANALLKVLEEPVGKVYYLLTTEHLSAMPVTIQSRCQKYYFPPVPKQMCLDFITEQGYNQQLLPLLQGSPLAAAKLSQTEVLGQRQKVIEVLLSLMANELSPIQAAAAWLKLGGDFVLDILYHWHADAIKVATVKSVAELVNDDYRPQISTYAKDMQENKLFTILEEIQAIIGSLRMNQQINLHLWLDILAIKIIKG